MKGKVVRIAIILAILVAGMSMAALPGAALDGIPPGATIDSATLWLNTDYTSTAAQIRAHQVNVAWDEATVTWNSFYAVPSPYNPAVAASAMSNAADPLGFDVTTIVQQWVSGAVPNHGLLLEQDLIGFTNFHSSEFGTVANRPALQVCYHTSTIAPTCVSIQRGTYGVVADTYISEVLPDMNYGAAPELLTGLLSAKQKQILIWFDLPSVPEGCTLTPGYWKTHSAYGPAPYDDTWAQVGEDTPFFLSGQSYYQVLWTPPDGGNAYYILAHAYIAAELNFLNGADPSAAQDAFNQATVLFGTYTPAQVDAMKQTDKAMRGTFISLAETLDNYNNGLIGPGHCME